MIRTQCYIGGKWIDSAASETLPVINPATGDVIARISVGDPIDANRAVAAARGALHGWSAVPIPERVAALDRIRAGLERRIEEAAALITAEMGSPLWFSKASQTTAPLKNLDIAARAMERLNVNEAIGPSLVVREPVGVVAAITPWNFPLHQITAKIAPALAAGCTVVLKPSEITPLDGYLLAEVIDDADLPAGVFNLVQGVGKNVGEPLAAHLDVDMISFTGSTRTGLHINAVAAAGLKKVTLELGGKSANVILEDADESLAIPGALRQCFTNSGQVCAALSRLLVPRHRLYRFEELLVDAASSWIVGDPLAPETKMGPLASGAQQRRVRNYIRSGQREKARLLLGGSTLPSCLRQGAYVLPTIFSDVRPDMTIARDEIFGPVLSIMAYENEAHAVQIANDTQFGLSGGVWSGSLSKAVALARQLRTGHVTINGTRLNLEAPFGGRKQSGLGRELGRYGLDEYMTVQSLEGAA